MKTMNSGNRIGLLALYLLALLTCVLQGCGVGTSQNDQIAPDPTEAGALPQEAPASQPQTEVAQTPPETDNQITRAKEQLAQAQSASRADELDQPLYRTYAAVGLYHLLATLDPRFVLGTSVSMESFEAFLGAHLGELGYLMRSSYELAAEFRECLDLGQLDREEIVYMLSDAVEGEMTQEYPGLLPQAVQLLGAQDTPTEAALAEPFTENFLREMSMQGGECKRLERAGLEVDCSLFRQLPVL